MRLSCVKDKKVFQGVLFLLITTGFFELNLIYVPMYSWIQLFVCLFMIACALKTRPGFSGKAILVYFFFFMLSCLYGLFYHGQSIIDALRLASPMYLGLFSYFLWARQNVSVAEVFSTLRCYAIIFCLCYIFQWLVYPYVFFNGALDKINVTNAYYRLRMPGSIGAFYLFFDGLSMFLRGKKKGILLSFLGILPILIMGFRSLTVLACLFSVMLMFQVFKVKKYKSWIFLSGALLLFFVALQVPFVQNKLGEMQDRQESDQSFSNPDYVRYVEFYYYTNYVFVDAGGKFLGGGIPIEGAYANKFKIAYDKKLYWVDWGLLGLAMIIGPLTVLLLVIMVLRCAWKSDGDDLVHLRYTLLTAVFGSVVTSMELFRQGNLLIVGVMLYLEFVYNEKRMFKKGTLER